MLVSHGGLKREFRGSYLPAGDKAASLSPNEAVLKEVPTPHPENRAVGPTNSLYV